MSAHPEGPQVSSSAAAHAVPPTDGPPTSADRPGVDYRAYIAGHAWRASPARLAELASSGGRCRLCAAGGPDVRLEVHHNTYARLGCEEPRDLCTLCASCHAVVTGELRRRRYERVLLPVPADVPRVLPGRRLVDSSHDMGGWAWAP